MMKYLHDDHNAHSGHEEMHDHVHQHTHTHTHEGNTHDHAHTHMHEHAASEGHEHKHDDTELHMADKEMQTLYVLLDHWVEHNISHESSFNEWAAKAENFGKSETAAAIKEAVHYMEHANEMLKIAKDKMK